MLSWSLRVLAVVAAMGATAALTCASASSESLAADPSTVKDKLVAAGLRCGDNGISTRTMDDGSDPFATVECYTATGWYQVNVWDSAEGLQTWWAARCANQSTDTGPRAVGTYWTTDIQTREETQLIANALGGTVKTTAEWCASGIGANPAAIPPPP